MKNYIHDGSTIPVTAPADVASGETVVVGSIVGVAVAAALSGDPVQITRVGAFTMSKVSAQAWSEGDRIYIDGSGLATNVASTNKFAGVALADAANPSATGNVLLTGSHHL